MIVNNELERIWKETIVVYCKMQYKYLLEGLRKTRKFVIENDLRPNRYSKWAHLEHKSELHRLDQKVQ
jgi:hypothetical protein